MPTTRTQQPSSFLRADEFPRLSVVLPVYDEAETIRVLIPEIVETLSQLGPTFEIVVVDDGSTDETPAILRQLIRRYPSQLRVAQHLRNRGNGASLRTAIRLAQGEIVVCMDADGQHSPADIALLADLIPPYDLVIGARKLHYRGSWKRGAANRFFNAFATWLSRTPVEDLTSGFRAMRRSVALHFLPLFPAGFSAPTTTTLAFLKAGYNVAFVPIHVRQRTAGRSKIRLWEDGARFVTIILRMAMLYDPLRIFLPIGVVLALLGVAAEAAGLINAQRLVLANSAVFFFTAALLTWLLGLISDQVSSTRVQYHGDESVAILGENDPAA